MADPTDRTLAQQVSSVCDEAKRLLPGAELREQIERIQAKLTEPLRVAVSGSVSSGKSTLVNALLGQRIAEVGQGECTRLVTWFRHDHYERIVVERRDGTTATLAFERGHRIPADLGTRAEDIERLVVYLSNDRLRDLSIIDTPGMNTVTEANEAVTSDFLGLQDESATGGASKSAMSQADALIFLMPHVRAHDVDVLSQFRNLFGGTGLSAVNVVGVLSKIDKLSPDGDPWPVAHRLAGRAREELGAVVCDVVPVNGLLAETALTDRFTEDDTAALRHLAGLDEMDLEDLLLTQQDLLESDLAGDLPRERRARLLDLLDLHGIASAVEAVRAGADTRELLDRLSEESGFEPLEQVVVQLFARRSGALKAHAGLAELRRLTLELSGDPERTDDLVSLRRALERIELDPALHDLRLFEMLLRVQDGSFRLPAELAADLRRLTLESTPAGRVGLGSTASTDEIRTAAAARAKAWARWGNDARRGPDEERFADDARSTYEQLWSAAREGAAS